MRAEPGDDRTMALRAGGRDALRLACFRLTELSCFGGTRSVVSVFVSRRVGLGSGRGYGFEAAGHPPSVRSGSERSGLFVPRPGPAARGVHAPRPVRNVLFRTLAGLIGTRSWPPRVALRALRRNVPPPEGWHLTLDPWQLSLEGRVPSRPSLASANPQHEGRTPFRPA